MKIVRLDRLEELIKNIDKESQSFALLAGGTDIMPALNLGIFEKEIIYDISNFENTLHFIKVEKNYVEIGALTPLSEIAANKTVIEMIPQLAMAINSIGSRQIRNMATLAGNIANASSIADSAPVLLTKGATINVLSVNGDRQISIDDFFIDYKKTSLRKNELIKSITINFNDPSGKYGFIKVAVRPEMAISKVNFAYAIEKDRVIFASGGVCKSPVRLKNVENNWGKELREIDWSQIVSKDISPISDLRSTAEYRKKVLVNIIAELAGSFQG